MLSTAFRTAAEEKLARVGVPGAQIAANLKPFTDLTGINVEISTFPLEALVQKVALDFGAGRGQYQIVYADPYQVLAPYRKALVDLNQFMNDDDLPSIPKGTDDFFETRLVVAYLTFNLPFAIWIMNAFFIDLPAELEESAMVDGATRFRAFFRVILPLAAPGIATTAILCFLFAWNDYAFATTFAGPNSQTIPLAAAQLVTQTGIDWGAMVSIGTVVVLPMIFVGLLVRRYLVAGLTMGAVKE